MKTAEEFAKHYLNFVLGDRRGLDYREIVQDEEIENEIVKQLADMVAARDLDAFRAGMTKAHEEFQEEFQCAKDNGCEFNVCLARALKAILTARDNLKELP